MLFLKFCDVLAFIRLLKFIFLCDLSFQINTFVPSFVSTSGSMKHGSRPNITLFKVLYICNIFIHPPKLCEAGIIILTLQMRELTQELVEGLPQVTLRI